MSREARAIWIQRSLMLLLAAAILGGVWFYRERVQHKITAPLKAAGPKHSVEIIHYHQPNNPDSERIAGILNNVEGKYAGQVLVTRVDINANPERAKAERVTKAPAVVIMAGNARALEFQGLWPEEQIKRKVDEIVHGLRRMDRNWMPSGVSRR